MKIGFIGLGTMGGHMAFNARTKGGFEMIVHDLRREASLRHVDAGAVWADDVATLARGADVVLTSLPGPKEVEAVGEVLLANMRSGAPWFDLSTNSPTVVRRLHASFAAKGIPMLDAPVSGGAVAAEKGELTIMASGPPEAFAAADPALEACARTVHRLGAAPGIGSSIKAVNQLLAGVNLVTAAEGMAFGVALGADPKVLYEVIRGAAGGSWMFDNRVPHMLDDDYAPKSACDIWVKDLGMVLGIGADLRMPLPMAAAAFQVVMMAAANGLGPIDDAGFVKVYESFTGKRIADAKSEGARR